MILSHMAPSSFNMSSYRAIWTHFKQNSIIFHAATYPQVEDLIGGSIFLKKKCLRQRTHKLGASKNMGAILLKRKSACGNIPTSWGLQTNH